MNNAPGPDATHDAPFSAGGRHAAAADRPLIQGNGDDDETIDHAALLAGVARDARLNSKYLLLITLAACLATLGLLQNSPAVVIGAMLVSPLLGPIMGMGFGLVTLDSALVRRSLITLAAGVAVAILVAVVLVWISPVQDVTDELRARTRPTLFDLAVAIVGGVAGVYAILRKLSGVMVGVAIATALVPPLSTVGFGLATWRPEFALGASLLFLTNTLAIALAATIVARFNSFGPSLTPKHTMRQVIGIVVALGLLAIPLGLSLKSIVLEIRARSAVQTVLASLLTEKDRIDTLTVTDEGGTIEVDSVVLVDRYVPDLNARLSKLASKRLDSPINANIVQLRQQSNTAIELEDSVNRRLTALESRDAETEAILSELTVGGLIAREDIVLDPQARRAVVRLGASDTEDRVSQAIRRVIEAVRVRHPNWLIAELAADGEG